MNEKSKEKTMSVFVPEGLRKQREFLDAQHAMQQPCWACGGLSNQTEALTRQKVTRDKFQCPHCHVPMDEAMPLVAVGPCIWYWSRPANLIVTATEWRTV